MHEPARERVEQPARRLRCLLREPQAVERVQVPEQHAAQREAAQHVAKWNMTQQATRQYVTEMLSSEGKKRVVFGATGADAIELAIKAARWYTGAPTILSAYGGYHGTTGGTMATTAKGGMWGFFYPVGPHEAGHAKIPYSYPYRCPVGADPEHCAEACVDFVRRMLRGKETPFGDARAVSNVAAVLVEPMQASAGYIIPGEGYLRGLRELCNELGFLLIDNEDAHERFLLDFQASLTVGGEVSSLEVGDKKIDVPDKKSG